MPENKLTNLIDSISNDLYIDTATNVNAVNAISSSTGCWNSGSASSNYIAGVDATTTTSTIAAPYGQTAIGYASLTSHYVNQNGNIFIPYNSYKEGDIEFDTKSMTLKIYSSDKSNWEIYEVDDVKIEKNKKDEKIVHFQCSKNLSIKELKEQRKKRYVIFEKTIPEPEIIVTSGFINTPLNLQHAVHTYTSPGTGTITIGDYNIYGATGISVDCTGTSTTIQANAQIGNITYT